MDYLSQKVFRQEKVELPAGMKTRPPRAMRRGAFSYGYERIFTFRMNVDYVEGCHIHCPASGEKAKLGFEVRSPTVVVALDPGERITCAEVYVDDPNMSDGDAAQLEDGSDEAKVFNRKSFKIGGLKLYSTKATYPLIGRTETRDGVERLPITIMYNDREEMCGVHCENMMRVLVTLQHHSFVSLLDRYLPEVGYTRFFIERCEGCKEHQGFTHHREEEYESASKQVHKWVCENLPYHAVETYLVSKPRIGALELYAINDDGAIVLLFSKLRSKRMPTSNDVRKAIAYVTNRNYRGGDFVESEVWRKTDPYRDEEGGREGRRGGSGGSNRSSHFSYYRGRETVDNLLSYSTKSAASLFNTATASSFATSSTAKGKGKGAKKEGRTRPSSAARLTYTGKSSSATDRPSRPLSAKGRSLNRELRGGTPEETGMGAVVRHGTAKYEMKEGPPIPGNAGRGKIYFKQKDEKGVEREGRMRAEEDIRMYKDELRQSHKPRIRPTPVPTSAKRLDKVIEEWEGVPTRYLQDQGLSTDDRRDRLAEESARWEYSPALAE
eukprot:CAMPEP_0113910710 /NCGR_PEP_ID=MMETSP0780_2-20120614/27703_1 /TAXON_ID=652834 /ORGANISM="Palpitomonas bilix" /LENGTH=551 /DNA_ID=CAMNT_0000906949 /DNA_START=403 /DNA_END=2055 /DNA_ORIENTATION=+ /assembly_acc=CAM_ASM_000599